MHMLSIAMEPILHKNCPPNCQDILAWLPHHVAIHVLSFLDLGNKNQLINRLFLTSKSHYMLYFLNVAKSETFLWNELYLHEN